MKKYFVTLLTLLILGASFTLPVFAETGATTIPRDPNEAIANPSGQPQIYNIPVTPPRDPNEALKPKTPTSETQNNTSSQLDPIIVNGNAPARSTTEGGLVPAECRAGLSGTCNLCKLFELGDRIIDFLLFEVAVPLIILALIVGGFQMITSGGDTKKVESGRKIVTNAVVGTLIAFLAWSAINTMILLLGVQLDTSGALSPSNWYEFPGCAKLKEITAPIVPPPSGGEEPPPPVGPGEYTDAEARAALNSNISVSSSGGCSNQQNASCTSLQGIPKDAIARINEIQANCNCHITITGGTEVGHASHGPSTPTVDFQYSESVLAGIRSSGYAINAGFGRGATCEPKGSPGVKMTCGPGAGHIHMEL